MRPTARMELDIMANEKKITKTQKYDMLLALEAVKSNPLLVEFIEHEKELIAKKNASGGNGERKQTPQQKINEGIKTAIYAEMVENRVYTISEMQKSLPSCADLTNQKVTNLVKQLREAGLVERTEDKGKAYFQKVVVEA